MRVALGGIAETIDYGLTASACGEPVGPKFLRITDIQDGTVHWDAVPWCECSARKREAARLRQGDIVFARTGATTGKSFRIDECPEDAVFASYLIRVRIGKSADPGYVSHFFRTEDYWGQIAQGARGVAQPGVNATTLRSLQIPLPPLAEQKRIAGILDTADALRAKRREALAQLDTLLQSIFLDMFGDPVTNPMGWKIQELSAACIKITDGTHHSPPTCREGIPYITAKHLKKDGLKFFDDPWFVSPEHHAQIFSRCDPVKDDVLYIKDGATTGIAAVNRYEFEFSMLSSLALLRPRPGTLASEYLCAYLNNDRNKSNLIGNMGGAAIKRLTLAKIKRFRIPVPPIDLQRRFATIVESVEGQKARMRAHLAELDALFASLQSRAFSGTL